MKERKIMSFDIADPRANAGAANPIAENPIPEAMAEAGKAIADFEAQVQEKAVAATVLSVVMSRTCRRGPGGLSRA